MVDEFVGRKVVIGCGDGWVVRGPSMEEGLGGVSLCYPIKGVSLMVAGGLWFVWEVCCDSCRMA